MEEIFTQRNQMYNKTNKKLKNRLNYFEPQKYLLEQGKLNFKLNLIKIMKIKLT